MRRSDLRYMDETGRVLMARVEYRTMTAKGLRQEASAIRVNAQRDMDKARVLEALADEREAETD